ncbi:transcriptional coactivator p15/PC4 family protein [Paraburkholderia tropica]|uniref:transcriptional coactivator p15/PC4 family protein n=1 Tax=Paraburkholderia tropica TaxID=92647 RepID=UPI002AB6AA34|nr:transcriptional coactivator p15/PC4 family protein [Paraburkholderia tropica]
MMQKNKGAGQGALGTAQSKHNITDSTAEVAPLVRFLDAVKNARERLRVDVKTYKGKTYLDCRVWFVGEDGEYHPSSKGFMVRPEMAPELLRGIDLAARSFDPKGAN